MGISGGWPLAAVGESTRSGRAGVLSPSGGEKRKIQRLDLREGRRQTGCDVGISRRTSFMIITAIE